MALCYRFLNLVNDDHSKAWKAVNDVSPGEEQKLPVSASSPHRLPAVFVMGGNPVAGQTELAHFRWRTHSSFEALVKLDEDHGWLDTAI
jgi:hypothetical protein